MAKFLFEILSEEIPANLQENGADTLYELFKKYSIESGVAVINQNIFFSSQRITILCDLKIEKKEIITHVRGPRIGVDKKILQSFLSSQKKQNYTQIELENGKYHGLEYQEILNETNEKTKENLAKICLKVLNNFDWEDAIMTWRSYLPKWIRPIRSILCILNDEIINFEFAGIQSSNKTHGHKILSNWKEIEIHNSDEYEKKLDDVFVIADQFKRMQIIQSHISNIDLKDANIEKLINELSCITEFPQIIELEIDKKFLSLPEDLIKYIMITHQRYIPQIENHKLSNKYYVIIDHSNPNETMKNGYKRVLNARLADGKFYWDKFINIELDILIENLKITKSEYIPDISVYDFNIKISEFFKDSDEILKMLNIASCDLSSELIIEYPSLRGLMAHEYLLKNQLSKQKKPHNNLYYGESELYEQFILPIDPFEEVIIFAKNILKAEYYIVEKKEKPTSSRDPFQIRKAIENSIELIFKDFFTKNCDPWITKNPSLSNYNFRNNENFKNIFLDVLLNLYYKNEEKFSSNQNLNSNNQIIKIAFDHFTQEHKLIFHYFEIKQFIFEQFKFIQNLCNFKWKDETHQSYKRIVQLCGKKYKDFQEEINENLLSKEEERDFFDLIQICKNELNFEKLQNIDFQNQISFTINNFFDKIRIEDSDEKIRNNRIALIYTFYSLIENFAPISQLF
jgi:glycyl-tRNA synthetase beta chain